MTDRDLGVHFDRDPNLDRPLRPETMEFLQAFRNSEFKYWGGNLMLGDDLDRYSESGRRQALWSRAFTEKLFSLQTFNEADRLLTPWVQWGVLHSQIWRQYLMGDGDAYAYARHEAAQRQFEAVDIPPGIREYQGDLSDEELRDQGHHMGYFARTREIKEAIDLIEETEEPVSLSTVFRVQRIMNRPFFPQGGLSPDQDTVDKTVVKRIEQDGQSFIAFVMEGDPEDLVVEDVSGEIHWQRWDRMEIGASIRYIREDPVTKQKQVETGTVFGFNLGAAGEAWIFEPSVKNVGIIAIDDETGFFRLPLVSDVRLDNEIITDEDLKVTPEKKVEAVFINPQTGESFVQEFDSNEDAFAAVKQAIVDTVEGNERLEPYNPKISPPQN